MLRKLILSSQTSPSWLFVYALKKSQTLALQVPETAVAMFWTQAIVLCMIISYVFDLLC